MRKRQRLVLALLLAQDMPPTPPQFMAWLFLLRHGGGLPDEAAGYDFVPTPAGPHSFEAGWDLDSLVRKGLLEPDTLAVPPKKRSEAQRLAGESTGVFAQVAAGVLDRYAPLPVEALRAAVRAHDPWYLSDPLERPQAPPAIYTIGYQGRSLDRFLDTLLRAGIRTLVDVRANPVSHKPGFAASTLRGVTAAVGLEYCPFPELGIDRTLRRGLETPEAHQALLDRYERELLPARREAVARLAEVVRGRPAALMCYEAEAGECHRGRLAWRLQEVTGLDVVHIRE